MPAPGTMCIDCRRTLAVTKTHLCRRCCGRKGDEAREDEWTEERLEALVAAQLLTMPPERQKPGDDSARRVAGVLRLRMLRRRGRRV